MRVSGLSRAHACRIGLRVASLLLMPCAGLFAGDWPQVLGPSRDGHAANESLADWQSAPPKILWQATLGTGYGGVAVQGEWIVVHDRQRDEERLVALDPVKGTERWVTRFPATYQTTIDPDAGPRCVPVISNDTVIGYGAAGEVRCLSLVDGKTRWTRSLREELAARDGYFGAGSTPIVIDDTVIVCVGGESGGIAGLSLSDGSIKWKTPGSEAAYASPTLLTLGSERLVVCVLRLETWLIQPRDGKVRGVWPFGARGPTVNAATPIVRGPRSFLTASYGIGGVLVDWTKKPEEVWSNDRSLSSQYVTPVLVGDYLYGVHGREDQGTGALRCVAWGDGRVMWEESNFGIAHLIAVDGNEMLASKTNGEVVRFRASPDGFESLGSVTMPQHGSYRALPALANGVLYGRATEATGGTLVALRVGKM